MKTRDAAMPELVITGLGLATSVGHDDKTACSSIRMDLKRPDRLGHYYSDTDVPFEDDEDGYVTGHPVLGGDANDRETRMVSLLAMAFKSLMENPGMDEGFLKNTPMYLALPEKDRFAVDEEAFLERLKESTEIHFRDTGLNIYPLGHAGMIYALNDAAEALRTHTCQQVLVAGTDSLIGFDDLVRYSGQNRLKTILNSDGFMPGEAASVILAETKGSARKRKAPTRCTIRSIAKTLEPRSVLCGNPSTGDGLVKAVLSLADREPDTALFADSIISDMNGETYRAFEWAIIQPRLKTRLAGEVNVILPARSAGDTGAASAGISVCLAAHAMDRGYLALDPDSKSGNALILSASDTGERGALLLSEPDDNDV